ncbi:hypothetical protein [Aestuariibius sp. HNIBRBA575]|uniref:hypothetical protein n=1 Tax=Aestuariibius sp. HNIBRBA575 TaxID=3233343 RepID=UPI0034A39DF3
MENAVLFDNNGYSLHAELRRNARQVVVFFPNKSETGAATERAAETAFGARFGLNIVTVRSDNADWFLGAAFDECLEALEHMCGWFTHVTFVGTGMGAYGAIKAATRIAADHVIAMSPVAALDPDALPADNRFAKDFKQLGELDAVTDHKAQAYSVLYDSADCEHRHVQILNLPDARTAYYKASGTAQRIQRCLLETGLLDRVLLRLIARRRVADLMGQFRRAKRDTPGYLLTMFSANLWRRPDVSSHMLDEMRRLQILPNRHQRMQTRLNRVLERRAGQKQAA